MKQGWILAGCIVIGMALGLAGCGSSVSGTAAAPSYSASHSAQIVVTAPTLASLQADLAAAGKPMPDFIGGGATVSAQAAQMANPANYMYRIAYDTWTPRQYVAQGRTQWYEVSLNSLWFAYDAVVDTVSGDPDLYFFTPLRANPINPEYSLILLDYSVGGDRMDEQVGSFRPIDWGGRGWYCIAVYGWRASSFRVGYF